MISTVPSGHFWKHSMLVTPGACGKRKTASRSVNGVPVGCAPQAEKASQGGATNPCQDCPPS